MSMIDVKVPAIGDFANVPVIEVLVKPGDSVKAEDPLIALESDKATMEVPAPSAGKIAEIVIKVGDKVSEGSLILKLVPEGAAASAPAASNGQEAKEAPPPTPQAAHASGPS